MDPRKTTLNDAINTAAEVAVQRAAREKQAAREKRQDKIAQYIGELLGGVVVTTVAAYPLMVSLDGFGVSASYGGCFLLIGSVRMSLGFLASKSRR